MFLHSLRNIHLEQKNPFSLQRSCFFQARRVTQYFVITVVFLIISACRDTAKQTPPPAPPPVVEVTEVQQRDVPIYQEWIGTLDGMVNAQILAQVTGYLIKQVYQEGQPIKKGQILYEIDPRTFQATLDQAKANLARQEAVLTTARLDMERIKRLLPQNAVSVRDRDTAVGNEASAQAQWMAAQAAVRRAELELEFTRILSPIDGIAGISQAQLGNLVGPGNSNAVLTTVSQVNPIKAYIPLSEQQYLRFQREKPKNEESPPPVPLELTLADGSVYPYTGRLYFADRQVDIKTGTIKVAVLFPNPDHLLRPGQYARVRAVIRTRTGALLVPQRAVTDMQGKAMMAVVNPDQTVTMRFVKTAEPFGTEWIIEEGIKQGEQIIVEGHQRVRDGIKVQAKPYVVSADENTR